MPRSRSGLILALLFPVAAFAAAPSFDQAFDHAFELHTAGRLAEALREYRAVGGECGGRSGGGGGGAQQRLRDPDDLGEYRAALPDCREALRLRRAEGDPETRRRDAQQPGLGPRRAGGDGGGRARLPRGAGDQPPAGRRRSRGDQPLEPRRPRLRAPGATRRPWSLHAAGRGSGGAAPRGALGRRSRRGSPASTRGWCWRRWAPTARRSTSTRSCSPPRGAGADPGRRAALLVNTGVIYRNLGDPVKAVESRSGRRSRPTAGPATRRRSRTPI